MVAGHPVLDPDPAVMIAHQGPGQVEPQAFSPGRHAVAIAQPVEDPLF